MNYTLSQVLSYNTNGILCVITFYDINCQYSKFFKDQIISSMYLSILIDMNIIPRIGLWYVYGHQDSCYVWYALNFICGTSRIDREIIKTLWTSLNIISPLVRGMGTPHCKKVLNYQINNSNFMKMICISDLPTSRYTNIFQSHIIYFWLTFSAAKFLCKRFKEAVKGAAESKLSFQNLNELSHPNMVILWEAEEVLTQVNRLENPTAIVIYEVQLGNGKCQILLLLIWVRSHFNYYLDVNIYGFNQKAARVAPAVDSKSFRSFSY